MLGVGIIVSIPICYLACKVQVITCIVAGLPAGIALGMVLQTAVIYMINYAYTIYIVSGALSLITIALCLSFDHHAISVANAITSSYVYNDCCDIDVDSVALPNRPLPSAMLSKREAQLWSLFLFENRSFWTFHHFLGFSITACTRASVEVNHSTRKSPQRT